MPEWPGRYDPDERFTLHPLTGEEAVRQLLGIENEDGVPVEEPEPAEDEDS